jgi:predicted secreted protein
MLIKLRAEPGTGFQWTVASLSPGGLLKSARADEFVEDADRSDGPIGGRQYQIISFDAMTQGTAEINLEYRRPWEKGTAPSKSIRFRVRIE